jgi:SAM-dependent methyltransferase
MDWTHGYHTADGYTYGYFVETSPKRLAWAAALCGVSLEAEKFRYLDLGCGQGFGLIINAACHPDSEFVGIDFMPSHIAHARKLAQEANLTNVKFYEIDFLDAESHISELGEFDYAVAHGISSWISPAIREAMIQLAARLLRPSGVFYNSYNSMPGWLAMLPFHQVAAHLKRAGKVDDYLEEARRLMGKVNDATGTLYKSFPELEKRLEKLGSGDTNYLLHEYGNEFWEPLSSSDMIQLARKFKLEFLCSATLSEIPSGTYPPKLLELIDSQNSIEGKELVKDLALHQSFRRDLYIKGCPSQWRQPFDQFSHIPLRPSKMVAIPDKKPFVIKGAGLQINGNYEIYKSILEKFNDATLTVSELAAKIPKAKPADLVAIVTNLISGGWLVPASDASPEAAQRLNKVISKRVTDGAPYQFLAAPWFCQGLSLRDTDMMCYGHSIEDSSEKEIAKKLLKNMQMLGKHFVKEGQTIKSQSESQKIAEELVQRFLSHKKPVLDAGGAYL